MKNYIFLLFTFYICHFEILKCQSSFKANQLLSQRVKFAYLEKGKIVDRMLEEKGFSTLGNDLLLINYKKESELEVWVKTKKQSKYTLLNQYPVCETSGKLGPKRREGDYQIPEGYYHIAQFNPNSTFHFALLVSYPNKSDQILGYKPKLGGDICIHGSCVTIGCIPITDEYIKELYILAIEAKESGQKQIPVWIFPSRMDSVSFSILENEYKEEPKLLEFWRDLKKGYDLFQLDHKIPVIEIDNKGRYTFRKN